MKTSGWTTQAVYLLGFIVLSGCGSTAPSSTTATPRVGTSHDQTAIQILHRRLHERERTIAIQNYQLEVMTSQLEALKRIDQDTREQRRPMRNLINIAP